MENKTNPQPATPPKQNRKHLWIVIVTIFLTAVTVSSVVYAWEVLKAKTTEQILQQQISLQKDQITQLQAKLKNQQTANNQPDTNLTKAEQLKLKFSYDIYRSRQVNDVFQNPHDPNIFVYITSDSGTQTISKFDTTKDQNYLHDQTPNIAAYNQPLLDEKIAAGYEFQGVGFDGSKFVFATIGIDYSPGPCFSPWQLSNLSYIDLSAASTTKEAYTVSDQIKQDVETEIVKCQNDLGIN